MMRFLRALGAFWYDFLIGDRPEIFVGSIAAMAVVWVLIQVGLEPVIAGWVLTVFVLLVAGFSIRVASRAKHKAG